jgi:hypothetical protein
MSMPPTGEVEAHSALGSGARSSPGPEGFLRHQPRHVRAIDHVADGDHEALTCGIVATGAGGVGAAVLVRKVVPTLTSKKH